MKMMECEMGGTAWSSHGELRIFKCSMEHDGRLHRVVVAANSVPEADMIAQNVVLRLCSARPPVLDSGESFPETASHAAGADAQNTAATQPQGKAYEPDCGGNGGNNVDDEKDDGSPPSARQKSLYYAMCKNLGRHTNKTAQARWGVKNADAMTGHQCWMLANELKREAEAIPVREAQISQCHELCSLLSVNMKELIEGSGQNLATMTCADMGLVIKDLRDTAKRHGYKV